MPSEKGPQEPNTFPAQEKTVDMAAFAKEIEDLARSYREGTIAIQPADDFDFNKLTLADQEVWSAFINDAPLPTLLSVYAGYIGDLKESLLKLNHESPEYKVRKAFSRFVSNRVQEAMALDASRED